MWCLKVVSEAVERLLITAYIAQRDESAHDPANTDALDNLIKLCDKDNLASALQDPSTQQYVEDDLTFQEKVRNGKLGKTAVFWVSFLDHARRVFMLIYAVKSNDLKLFHKCMGDMAELFFTFGGHNYARYLAWFDVFLTNIEVSHPGATELLENGAISVARSHTPGNLCAVDKTMEETFMKFAKSRGGSGGAELTGILENYGAYQRWVRTSSARCRFYKATLEMSGMSGDSDSPKSGKHRDLLQTEITRSEKAVKRTMDAIHGFLNLFEMTDMEHLYKLSSGAAVSTDIEEDVFAAEKMGQKEKKVFIQQRHQQEEVDFFYKITKLKLNTIEKTNKTVKLTSVQGQVVKFQEQGDIAFQLLVKSQMLSNPISIDELITYSITPIPHCLGTPDGYMTKTNKATIVHYLTNDVPDARLPSTASETLFIEDGKALVHALKDLPPTFKHISFKLLDQLRNKPDVIFSTDMYVQDSIKAQERQRRGCREKMLLEGINTRKPADIKLFLQNDDSKIQLFKLMLRVWSSDDAAERLTGRKVILIVDGKAFLLTSDGQTVQQVEINSLRSTQEETDSRVVLYLFHAKKKQYKYAVVHSPDSDIFFILLYYVHRLNPLIVLFDTGTREHRRLLNVTEIGLDLGQKLCEAFFGLYCYTGEDCNCAFKGKGKVNPLKKLEKKPKFQDCFGRLGDNWDLDNDLVDQLEEFTCIMYSYPEFVL